ncbi:MAG: UDP-glucose 4-epimerase GalE [Pseudomonadota bacterium]
MTILVTGGAGYIGSHLVLDLCDRGETVWVLDDLSTGSRALVPEGVRLIEGDVADRALLDHLLGETPIEAVFHFAGSIIVPESHSDPLKYYRNNTAASRTLIEAAVAAGVERFVFSSTAAVYGNPAESPIREDSTLAPISPYGTSKLMTEWMLRDVATAHALRYVCLRYFNVAGADPKGRSGQSAENATHLIKVAAQAALGLRSRLEIFGTDYPTPDGTCIRDYIHVSDLARAHTLALDHLRGGGESLTVNCGYGQGYSVRAVVEAVRRVHGAPFEVIESARRPGDPAGLVADPTTIRQALGWQPELDDLDTIVAQALAWERQLAATP